MEEERVLLHVLSSDVTEEDMLFFLHSWEGRPEKNLLLRRRAILLKIKACPFLELCTLRSNEPWEMEWFKPLEELLLQKPCPGKEDIEKLIRIAPMVLKEKLGTFFDLHEGECLCIVHW